MTDNLEIDRLVEEAKTAAKEYGCAVFGDAGIDRCCATWDSFVFVINRLATLARTPSGMAEDAARYQWLRSGVVTRQGRALVDRIHREINRSRYSALLAFRAWCEQEELDAAIDTALASTPLQEAE